MNIDSVNGLIDELKQRANPVDYSVKLPDAEFDVMSAIWAGNPPVNTAYLTWKCRDPSGVWIWQRYLSSARFC